MSHAELEKAQAGIKIARRNINILRYADDTTLTAESKEEELKGQLMKVKEENQNFGLKLNIQKTKIIASSPIISWQIWGKDYSQLVYTDCNHSIYGENTRNHLFRQCVKFFKRELK